MLYMTNQRHFSDSLSFIYKTFYFHTLKINPEGGEMLIFCCGGGEVGGGLFVLLWFRFSYSFSSVHGS